MQTQLQLPLADAIGGLLHIAKLRAQIVRQAVAQRAIGAVSVKKLDGIAIANGALAVDEKLVVERQVDGALIQIILIERDAEKKVIAKARAHVLTLHPSLLEAIAVCEEKSRSDAMRKQSFLVYPALRPRFFAVTEGAGADEGVA